MFWGIIIVIISLIVLGLGVWNFYELFTTPAFLQTTDSWKDALWATVLTIGGAILLGTGLAHAAPKNVTVQKYFGTLGPQGQRYVAVETTTV